MVTLFEKFLLLTPVVLQGGLTQQFVAGYTPSDDVVDWAYLA